MTELIATAMTCKNCGSTDVVRFGTYKDTQLWWCKGCERNFKQDDSLFHSKVSGDIISSALSMYYTGMSINVLRNVVVTLNHQYQ